MKRMTSRQLTPAQQAEIEALATLPDEQIDTQDIPELSDWSGKQRGLFYQGDQQVTNEQNSHDYRDKPLTMRKILVHLLPQDFPSLMLIIGLVVGIGYYIYSHDLLVLLLFLSMGAGMGMEAAIGKGKISEMLQPRKNEVSTHRYQPKENEPATHKRQSHS